MRRQKILHRSDGKYTTVYQIGHLISAAGGTRINDAELAGRALVGNDRPWQPFVTLQPYSSPEECPFEKNRQINQIKKTFGDVTLRRFENSGTPFREGRHHLIIPDVYNPDHATLAALYGKEHIVSSIAFAKNTMEELYESWYPVQFNVHIGLTAGQRIQWLHWHLIQCMDSISSTEMNFVNDFLESIHSHLSCVDDADFLVLEKDGFSVFAGGSRAGSLFFIPPQKKSTDEKLNPEILGSFINSFITLCNGAFLSKQGMSPEYSLNLMFSSSGDFYLGYYVPILNFQGGTEYWAQLLNLPEIMPIKHEETAALLRNYIATHAF